MNQSPNPNGTNPNNRISENPWKNFADLPKPEGKTLGIAGILYGLASLTVPLGFLYDWLAVVSWVILLAGSFYLTRKFSLGASLTLTASLLAFVFLGFSPAVGALIAALCVGVMCGTFFQTSTRKFWVPALLSVAAGGAVFALSHNWLIALTALSLLPATLLLSVATNRGEYRTVAICFAEGGLLLAAVILGALWILQTYGKLDPDTVRGLFNGWQEQMVQAQIALRDEYISYLEAFSGVNAGDVTAMVDRMREMMSDEAIASAAATVFGYLPALICVACAIPAFLSQKMLNSAYMANGMNTVLTPEAEFFTMSVPAAVIYILSTVAVFCFSPESMPVIVAGNLSILLLPGFLVVGVRVFQTRFSHAPAGLRWMFILIAVSLFCCTSFGILFLIALYGAYARILSAVRHKMEERMEQDRD